MGFIRFNTFNLYTRKYGLLDESNIYIQEHLESTWGDFEHYILDSNHSTILAPNIKHLRSFLNLFNKFFPDLDME